MTLPEIVPGPIPPEMMTILAWAVAVPSLLLVAVIDCRRLEIDPWLCAVAVLAGAVLADPSSPWADGLLGSALALALNLLILRIRPASMGLGDLYLYAACGFLVGATGLTAWVLLHAAAAAALILVMSRRRRRRVRRTTVPAAVTACPAAILVMLA